MIMHEYANREQLAEALAAGVAAVLGGGIAARGSAILAVSGGTTPELFLSRLSQAEIAWEQVTVTLVDERVVAPDDPRSNMGLVTRTLLQNRASKATAVPLYGGNEPDLRTAAEEANRRISWLGRIDAAVLGMGSDGHTASFFPGGDRLAEALDPACKRDVVAINAPGAREPRLTLTLNRLLDAHFLALHIEGKEKRKVLEAALGTGPAEAMPVRAVLRGAGDRLKLFWAP